MSSNLSPCLVTSCFSRTAALATKPVTVPSSSLASPAWSFPSDILGRVNTLASLSPDFPVLSGMHQVTSSLSSLDLSGHDFPSDVALQVWCLPVGPEHRSYLLVSVFSRQSTNPLAALTLACLAGISLYCLSAASPLCTPTKLTPSTHPPRPQCCFGCIIPIPLFPVLLAQNSAMLSYHSSLGKWVSHFLHGSLLPAAALVLQKCEVPLK